MTEDIFPSADEVSRLRAELAKANEQRQENRNLYAEAMALAERHHKDGQSFYERLIAAQATLASVTVERDALREVLAVFREFVLHNVTQAKGWNGHPIWPLVAEAIGEDRYRYDKGPIWQFIQHDNHDASLFRAALSRPEPKETTHDNP